MPGVHLEPGDKATVELVADSSGNVATEDDLVEISGETSSHTQVSVVENAGAGVAVLDRVPEEYDPDATYEAGDVVGETMVRIRHPVEWLTPTDGYDATVADQVVSDVGGTVAAFDEAGGDTADMILGVVWATNSRGTEYVAGQVAVIRHR